MVLDRRSRGATSIIPSGTVVARRKSDQRAGHLFRFASTPLALRLGGFALSQERAREGTYNRSVLTKRSQIDQADAGVREYRWCSTAGREARPVCRPVARHAGRKTEERQRGRPPFSIRFLTPLARSASAASRSRRKRAKGIAITGHFDETKPKRSGKCWGSGTSMVLHHRSRSATGSHPSVTVVARQRATSAPRILSRFASTPLALSPRRLSRSRKKRERGDTQSERFDETKPNESGRCWSSGISILLHIA